MVSQKHVTGRQDTVLPWIYQHLLLPIADVASGQSVMSHYRAFAEAQWWDRARLVDLQNRRLQETLRAAYRETRFYGDLYEGADIDLRDIQAVSDLPKLPIVTKDLLREASIDSFNRKPKGRVHALHTSGSTGKPLKVVVDEETMSISRALMMLRATFSGWRPGESYLQTGVSPKRGLVKAVKDWLLRVTYVSAFDLSDRALDRCLDIIERQSHRYVMGYAASLYMLASRAREVGFNWQLRGAVSWGDNLFPHYRSTIEQQFRCRVTDTYGCGEGIQVSAQCEHGAYHIFMPHVVVEYVRDGQPVAPGELGEVLLTRLNPGVMPLIRYSIGDVARGDTSTSCPCGRGLATMRSIEGRSTDIVVTPCGNRLIVHFFTGIFEYAKSISTFQVLQSERDSITVKVVPRGQFDSQEWAGICDEIREKGGGDLKINLELVDEIPLTASNKRRFVISTVHW